MKNHTRYFILLMVFLTMAIVSCEKFSGGDDSITGLWQCREESSSGTRQYSATIYSSDFDSTIYEIYNFHNLGNDVLTYVSMKDSTITILNMNASYSISGKGIAHDNFSEIDWDYSISGSGVNESNVHAYYSRK